jgi:serine/threonine-protein kinase HipA
MEEGQNDKVPVRFAYGRFKDTKYDFSMGKTIKLIDDYCTFPAIEKIKLFKLVIFNYLIGNEDSHLKNFSNITDDNQVRLSPCYDLVNSTIELKQQNEEIALPLDGKKKHLTRNILVNYFGADRCGLTEKSIEKVLETISIAIPKWKTLIAISFLSKEMKGKYLDLLNGRLTTLKVRHRT